jgi:hypothetical protein
MQRELLAAMGGFIDDVVDDKRDVVEHFDHLRDPDQVIADRRRRDRLVTAEDGERTEILGTRLELPAQVLLDLRIGRVDPCVDRASRPISLSRPSWATMSSTFPRGDSSTCAPRRMGVELAIPTVLGRAGVSCRFSPCTY